MGWGKAFYLKQLGFLATNDIEGLLREHYHEDAVMVTFDGIRRGHAELRAYFEGRLQSLGQIGYLATEYFAESEDTIIFKSAVRSAANKSEGEIHADNALIFKDGKIWRHIALTILPAYLQQGKYEAWGVIWKE
ncbi:MAG: nuclear transport factor 2 family protein [Chloroflexia bacterium]|nr:nuclear transport factor 2 family protein [Chloroflexia bacterium]